MKHTLSKCAAFSLICATLAGCQHAAPVNEAGPAAKSEAHYVHLFGQRYRTKADLYLFTFTADPDMTYLGRNDGRSPQLAAWLPATVNHVHVGQMISRVAGDGRGDLKIVAVFPSGSELTLIAETHEVTPWSGIRGTSGYPMGFICNITGGGRRADAVLAEFIQAHKEVTGKTPNQDIDETIAEKIGN